MRTTVWAFKRIPELGGATGFVACEAELAARLITEGKAQDPRVGGRELKYIEDDATYENKELHTAAPVVQKKTLHMPKHAHKGRR